MFRGVREVIKGERGEGGVNEKGRRRETTIPQRAIHPILRTLPSLPGGESKHLVEPLFSLPHFPLLIFFAFVRSLDSTAHHTHDANTIILLSYTISVRYGMRWIHDLYIPTAGFFS